MKNKFREAWCEECTGLSLIGGTQAVAALVGVDPRTIRNWCGAGQVHARRLIMMPFSWMDVMDLPDTVYYQGRDARTDLAYRILTHAIPVNRVLPYSPRVDVVPTDVTRHRSMLYQNAPNPFNPTTVIQFDLAEECTATLQIYDLAGRLVRNLEIENRPAGRQSITWDGRDSRGYRVASGIYLYRLQAGTFSATRKLVVLK